MKIFQYFFIYSIFLLCTFVKANELPEKVIQAKQAIYRIKNSTGGGTGFFIASHLFVTAFHVINKVKNLDEISLHKKNQPPIKVKKLWAISPYTDLAILQTEEKSAFYLSEGLPPELDEDLFIMGHLGGAINLQTMRRTGVIQAHSNLYYVIPFDSLEDASGMSGSPLLDSQGQFIGVVSSSIGNFKSIVPSHYLKKLLNGHIGTVCENKAGVCIKKEISTTQQQLEDYLDSEDFILDTGVTLFHQTFEYLEIFQNLENIKLYLLKGARLGNVSAQYNLGITYYNEKKVMKQNLKQAAYWLRKAAEQNHAFAQYNLGFLYLNGEGVKPDFKQAAYWLKRAAKQEFAPAQYNLGILYSKGKEVEQNFEQAVYWFQKAAEQGSVSAQYNLGALYFNGEGVERNFEQVVYWFQKAAEQGDVSAQYNLGTLYFNGEGVEQDSQQTIYWHKKAANQGYVLAQYNLGIAYDKGEGVKQSFKQAAYWYEKAAEQNHALAQYNLGVLYFYGEEGVKKDFKQAVYWFQKAAKQGNEEAQEALNTLNQ